MIISKESLDQLEYQTKLNAYHSRRLAAETHHNRRLRACLMGAAAYGALATAACIAMWVATR